MSHPDLCCLQIQLVLCLAFKCHFAGLCIMLYGAETRLKGRFLRFRMYHNFAYLFYKLSESSFYKEMSKF